MEQQDLTKEELLKEIAELRRRVTLLETSADNLKLVEKALEKSETKFKTLTEKSVVGVYVVQHGLFRYVNPKLADIFGYSVEEMIDGIPVMTVVFEADRRLLDGNLKMRLSGQVDSMNYTFRGVRKDGALIYVEVHGSRMDYQGAPAVIGSLVDITQRNMVEEAMKKEKKRFQLLCENVPFGVVMIGKDGNFEYRNPKFVELFGAEAKEPTFARPLCAGSETDSKDAVKADCFAGFADDSPEPCTQKAQCADGTEKIIHFKPVQLDNCGLLLTCEDITSRVTSEQALRESERRYKTLVEEINDGYFVVENQFITFANEAFCRMHGAALNDVLGSPFFSFVAPECRDLLLGSYLGSLESRTMTGQIQYDRIGAPQGHAATEVKARIVDLGNGPVIIGICRDISERVNMEAKIRENEQMAYVGSLSASLSHELRNPLSSIKMNLQILSRKLDLDGFDRRRLEITVHEVSRLESILRQLLDVARPLTITKTPVNLSILAGGCVELLESKAHEKNLTIIQRYPGNLPDCLLDVGKLEQAIINLLLNAIEATPMDGRITIWTKGSRNKDNKSVELGVRDSGPGIDPKHTPNLFKPFFTSKSHGTGLGLSNVKRIVEAHSGHVEVRSRKGSGAAFVLRLPCRT